MEKLGMLKMDFLGLKTLSIIKDAVENIKKSKGIIIDIENIPFDDAETFNLFSRGDTTGIFQFESDGMKKNLRELKPNRFEDLIAMNALYRPGPMDYIPSFIKRKNGKEKIEYDIPEMKDILEETYGITVYQEQVMQLSQKIAGFSRGNADSLRKAMGKKDMAQLEKSKSLYFQGALERNHDLKKIEKIWNDWKEFAKYAFNKSHSTCYAFVAYRMAYLKTHYPAEFMAAVLSRNLSDITKITFFIDEAKHMDIRVLKPDVNESEVNFIVNKAGEIRFGMAAIKGLGGNAVEEIIAERNRNGTFSNVFDFAKRINLRVVNKRSFEALAMAGAFDSFENTHRAQFFFRENTDDSIFIEKVIRFAIKYQERQNSQQVSLFGDIGEVESTDPLMPECKPWSGIEQLRNEKEVTGFYISGHPLDEYRIEMKNFAKYKISDFKDNFRKFNGRPIIFGGMVISAEHRTTQTNKPYGTFTLEDYDDIIELRLFSDDYLKFRHYLAEGFFLLIYARIQQRFKAEEQLEVKITNIILLPEVIEKQTKEIRLKIAIDDLSEELIDQLVDFARNTGGDCRLTFLVYDSLEKLNLSFNGANLKVNAQEFLKHIETIPEVTYQLN
jgi:DNA polymerase-3 subunit alpha